MSRTLETRRTTRQIRRRINRICQRSIRDFRGMGSTIDTQDGPLTFIDRGAKILGVAHLDTVLQAVPWWEGDRITCPQLDDRLGAWVLLELLPSLGCPAFDILLTDNEERGLSTARYFEQPRGYNWIFEFDRAGDDCVMYDYEDADTAKLAMDHGWEVCVGSYSDICELEHLGVKGFNFGTGYHRQHTPECYADIGDTIASAERFIAFASRLEDVKLPHVAGYWWDHCDDRSASADELCWNCNALIEPDWYFCPYCGRATENF